MKGMAGMGGEAMSMAKKGNVKSIKVKMKFHKPKDGKSMKKG
jgi:hypothetical protein